MVEDRTVKLARRRDGVNVFGGMVGENVRPGRVVHLVDVAADLESPHGVQAYCGLEFAAGTLVEVPWIEALPHSLCLRRSPWPRARIDADFRVANVTPEPEELPAGVAADVLAILGVIPEVAASIAEVDWLVGCRFGWVQESAGVPTWVYNRSFGGVLVDENRFPREHDLGIAPLAVEIVKPGVVRIRSCGVRDGCRDHAVRTEDVALDNVIAVKEWLTSVEKAARAVDLERLCWCLILGDCSARPMSDVACSMGRRKSDH